MLRFTKIQTNYFERDRETPRIENQRKRISEYQGARSTRRLHGNLVSSNSRRDGMACRGPGPVEGTAAVPADTSRFPGDDVTARWFERIGSDSKLRETLCAHHNSERRTVIFMNIFPRWPHSKYAFFSSKITKGAKRTGNRTKNRGTGVE